MAHVYHLEWPRWAMLRYALGQGQGPSETPLVLARQIQREVDTCRHAVFFEQGKEAQKIAVGEMLVVEAPHIFRARED